MCMICRSASNIPGFGSSHNMTTVQVPNQNPTEVNGSHMLKKKECPFSELMGKGLVKFENVKLL